MNLTNIRHFKYRKIKYVVAEIKETINGFYGCYKQIGNTRVCIINNWLSENEKNRTLHEIVKGRHIRRYKQGINL